ncbi:peroxidase [Steroidobacter agaridevorans]|uniref:Peroxidase n=1 Tax=Steroidobacter agaridevorans TaxID=2695856 RepID=A0A829YGJ8_9GAMM|nr:alpha/beta hydrolase [Steroidobacter agaridevorans]GFE82043.1 peroxidase [Steroidobacter agaridevorans]
MTAAREHLVTTRQIATRDGVMLVADVAGNADAPCVVLAHGGGQTRYSWQATLQALVAAGYRALAYDARGHGESGWSPDGKYSFFQRADDLRAVLDDAGGAAILIGASMGGITSMEAISSGLVRPEQVPALVLVDIVLRPQRSGVQRVRDFMASHPNGFATLEEAVDAVAAYNPHRPRPKDGGHLMRNLRPAADGRLRWHWDPRIVPDNIDDDMAELERIARSFEPPQTLPTLLVRGGDSDVVTPDSAHDFKRWMPHAEIAVVPKAGHMVAGDSNRTFNSAILDFLARHVRRRTQ